MKTAIRLASMLALVLLLPACSSRKDGPKSDGGTLHVLNWGDYIDESLIEEFEKKTGAKVEYDKFASDSELEAKLLTGGGGYDVVFPSDRSMTPLLAKKALAELDRDKLPNWKHLDDKFLGPRFDPKNSYSVPYFWGTLAVGIRTDHVKEPVEGFEALFDDRYSGRITMMDDPETVTAAALLHLKLPMNSTDPEHLARVKDLLVKQKPWVQAYTSDGYKDKLEKGEAWVSLGWNGDILQAARADKNVRVVIPKSGTLIWVDSMAIPEGAENKELAHRFIDFLLDPDVAARNADFVKYATPNKSARKKIAADVLNDPGIFPPKDVLDRCTWLLDKGAGIGRIEKMWREVKQ